MENKVTRAIKFDPKEWKKLTEMAREIGTTAAALVREMVHNKVKAAK